MHGAKVHLRSRTRLANASGKGMKRIRMATNDGCCGPQRVCLHTGHHRDGILLCYIFCILRSARGRATGASLGRCTTGLVRFSNGTGHLDGCATGLVRLSNGTGPVTQPVSATGSLSIRTSG